MTFIVLVVDVAAGSDVPFCQQNSKLCKKCSTSIIQYQIFIQEVTKGAVMRLTFSCC